jgi:hypothetical protein
LRITAVRTSAVYSALPAPEAGLPAHPLAAVDPAAPWLAHLAALNELRTAPAPLQALNALATAQGVTTASGMPVQFAPADDAGDRAYEAHIGATGRVPTRCAGPGALHDLFNALIWLALPQTKAALNARQAQEIARAGIGAMRGSVRDACTLIDESGLLLACADRAMFKTVRQALEDRDWNTLLLVRRADWHTRIVPVVLGHALLEKLVQPYKAITAQVVLFECPGPRGAGEFFDGSTLAQIDVRAVRFVQQPHLAPSLVAPLPLLGVPGWWRDNAQPSFYDDAAVFRPRRPLHVGSLRPSGK